MTHGFTPPAKRELRLKGKGLPHGTADTIAIGQGIASLDGVKTAVLQHSFRFPDRRGALFHLIDINTGRTLAIVSNNNGYVSLMRTAADAAVAAKYLSRRSSTIVGIIGTGRQGRAHLQYLLRVRSIERVYAHSGRRRDDEYAREMSRQLGIEVVAADRIEDVVKQADILTLATRATAPIVEGAWLPKGLHINGIGADCPLKAELDTTCIVRADKIVIDCEQVLDAADLRIPFTQGRVTQAIHGTIGEVVAGVKPGRENESEITIYKSTGTTLPYVTLTARIYEKALQAGLGTEVATVL